MYNKSGFGGVLFGFGSNRVEIGVEKYVKDSDEDFCDVMRSKRIVEESVIKCEN